MTDSDAEKKIIDDKQKQISAIGLVYNAIKDLTPEAAHSVLSYVNGMVAPQKKISHYSKDQGEQHEEHADQENGSKNSKTEDIDDALDDADGINSVAKKWLVRNGLSAHSLSKIFSLGLDEIDIVAKKVPGPNEQQRMRSVFLLKGIAAYLGSGAPRFTQEQVKEACEHYSAWNKTNYSTYIKGLSALVGGSAASGYILTSRGLTEAADLIKTMIPESEKK